MKRLRILAASAILSLAMLGGVAGAQAVTPSESFPECVRHMAMHGGVGPHVQGMEHEESTVGAHLLLMLSGGHVCMQEMDQTPQR